MANLRPEKTFHFRWPSKWAEVVGVGKERCSYKLLNR